MNKGIGVIIAVVVICIMFPLALSGIHNAQTESTSETFTGVTVAATACNVTLSAAPWDNLMANVTAVKATGSGAVPVAQTYTANTKVLHLHGLGTDTPQDVTVEYTTDATTDYVGLGQLMSITPLLIWIGIFAALVMGGRSYGKSKGWI